MKSLEDVMSAAGLHIYADIALIIFLTVFIAVLLRVLMARNSHWDYDANLPLEDDTAAPETPTPANHGT